MQFKIKIPNWGEKIELLSTGLFYVPDKPIITFIEGDGIGPDIWKVTRHVLDQSVQKAYGDKRKIAWTEIYAGEKSWEMGDRSNKAWLPDETIEAIKQYLISIKGPMTTPVAGGIRSINVALRQKLDLYICLRPVRHFKNVPSPVKKPELVNIVIFRENTEDIYSGIEFSWDSKEASNIKFLLEKFGLLNKVRFPNTSSFGIKPISIEGSSRLIRSAIEYVINNDRDSLTIVHKGNIMKYTEGSFRNCAYDVAKKEFGAVELDSGPWCVLKNPKTNRQIIIKDVITDAFLQQILTRPKEYSVIATMNLNGDYISDALAAQVGGIGISPGANLNYEKGLALFEATHGTAPKYANLDKVNPSSMILSGEMMLRHIGWLKAADLLIKGIEKAIQEKKVTYDFARLMPSSVEIKCSEFANEIIRYM